MKVRSLPEYVASMSCLKMVRTIICSQICVAHLANRFAFYFFFLLAWNRTALINNLDTLNNHGRK